MSPVQPAPRSPSRLSRLLARMAGFGGPVLANYYVTYRCNARCSFCDLWEKPSPYVQLADVQANLRDLWRLGVRVVDFTGGEPLLHRGLPDFLREAKQLGFLTTLTTNTLLYPKYSAALAGLVDMLHFSLDAATAEAHDTSRGVACYTHLLRSLDIAAALGERPDVLLTVHAGNLQDIEPVYRQLTQPRGLLLLLNPMFRYGDYGAELSPEALPELRRWARVPGVYLNEAFLALREAGGNDVQDPVCRAASTTVVITPTNALRLPCYHLGIEDVPIEGGLYATWHRPEVQALRHLEGRLPACQGCTINCYMQPSFADPRSRYFLQALPSSLRYTMQKWVWPAAEAPMA